MPTLSMSPGRSTRAILADIGAKLAAGERLSIEDGEALYAEPDVWRVCELADAVRRRLHGSAAYYNVNRHLNYSNVCALSCTFCEFYRKKGEPGAYTRSEEDIRSEARRAVEAGATEIHSVGGLNPYLPFDYYTRMLETIRRTADEFTPAGGDRLHVKAFTAVEIVHLAKMARVYKSGIGEEGLSARRQSIRWVLEELRKAGLGSLPGGGAEVFDDRVHDAAFKGKIRSDVWLDVHREAHALGLNSNATILYGHIEDRRERLVHMDMLRRAQDEALARLGYTGEGSAITLTRPGAELPERIVFGGREGRGQGGDVGSESRPTPGGMGGAGYFQTIIPLPFFPDGSELEHLPGPDGLENLRTLAICRLMLDNIPHVKAFWIMQTLPMAQLMLQCGADDVDGTVVWYDITKLPQGAPEGSRPATHQEVTAQALRGAIREAGFEPVERDTLYRRVERDANDPRKWRAVGFSGLGR